MQLDLAEFAAVLGDPTRYFVNQDGPVPLIVEHETGEPAFAVAGPSLVLYSTWKAQRNPTEPIPPPDGGNQLIAAPGRFQFGATVTEPE